MSSKRGLLNRSAALAAGVGFAALMSVALTPRLAMADNWKHQHRGHYADDGHRGHYDYDGRGYAVAPGYVYGGYYGGYYGLPPVYYTPPPVYYAPPQVYYQPLVYYQPPVYYGPPSLNFGITAAKQDDTKQPAKGAPQRKGVELLPAPSRFVDCKLKNGEYLAMSDTDCRAKGGTTS